MQYKSQTIQNKILHLHRKRFKHIFLYKIYAAILVDDYIEYNILYIRTDNNKNKNKNNITMAHVCENCKLRANYDANPKSFLGHVWRWHINFCPGWKAYFKSLPEDKKAEIRSKYDFKKY